MFYVLVVITLVTATTRAQTQIPTFANTGGPPDLTGAMYADFGYIGLLQPSGFASSVYLGQDSNEFQLQMGKYTSWECTGNAGEYRATATRRDIYSNGTVVIAQHCEIGKLVPPDSYYWISSTTGCPDVNTTFPESSRITILVNSTTLPPPDFSNLTCSEGANPVGMNTTTNAGLDLNNSTLGRTSLNTRIPEPLQRVDGFPPAFNYTGITPAVAGFYEIPSFGSIRTISPDGSFSVVTYNASGDDFVQSLGLYDSYECLQNVSGYRAAAIDSSFDQSGVLQLSSEGGCSVGEFLDSTASEVLIITGIFACPNISSQGRESFRVGSLNDAYFFRNQPKCLVPGDTSSSIMRIPGSMFVVVSTLIWMTV